MHVLGIVGPSGTGKTTVVERLADRLADRGRVATVKRLTHEPDIDTAGTDTDRHRSAGAETTYGITENAGWFAVGETRTLEDALDGLALSYDYALVEGFSDAAIPQIVLADHGHAGPALAEAADAGGIDSDTVIDALEDIEPYVTLETLVSQVKRSPDADRAGAIATFTGRVREKDSADDSATERLEFEKYEGIANRRLAELREDLEARDGVYTVRMHHRTGVIEPGEDIVFVVVLAGHRKEAFRTVEDGIDRLKEEVPIFKKEVTTDEEFWVHTQS